MRTKFDDWEKKVFVLDKNSNGEEFLLQVCNTEQLLYLILKELKKLRLRGVKRT